MSMSKTVRFKLSEEEYRVVLESANEVGLSVDRLAYQALAYVLRQARLLQDKAMETVAPGDDIARASEEDPISGTEHG